MDNNHTTEKAKKGTYHFDQGKPVLPKVSELRRKLAEKANREPKFQFYALYDRIYRLDVLVQFLRRKSQRPFRPPEGMSWYELIVKQLGVKRLVKTPGENPERVHQCSPDGGNLHVR